VGLKINNEDLGFPWNIIIGIPIICIVFSAIAVAFLTVVALLLSPVILIVWLVAK